MTQHAPQPPVVANQPVAGAQQPCPLMARKPCEVKRLKVKVKFASASDSSSSGVVTVLEAEKKRRGEPIPRPVQQKLGASVVALLNKYDLVIEALAGFPSKAHEEAGAVAKDTKVAANHAEIEVETEQAGVCGYALHPLILMKPANVPQNPVEIAPPPMNGQERMVLREAAWKPGVTKVAIKQIIAPTFKADIAGGDNPFAQIIRLIMWVWNANKSIDIELSSSSCGIRSATENGIQDLNALVRVYRDITVAVGIKVPPALKYTESAVRTLGIGTSQITTKVEITARGSGTQITSESTRLRANDKIMAISTWSFHQLPEDEFGLYFKFNELEFAFSEKNKVVDQATALNTARKNVMAKVAHWKDERAKKAAMDKVLKEVFGDFLTFRDKLGIFFENFVSKLRGIVDALKSALDLMKKFPQLGFKLTCEIGFLSGDVFFGWGHTPLDSSQPYHGPLADRYAPLLHKIHVESKIQLITFKVEGGFGLLIDAGTMGKVEARVAGAVNLEIAWTTALDVIVGAGAANGRDADTLGQNLSGTSTGNLRATFEVKIAVFSYKAEIGIETGIVVEGKIDWKLMQGEITYSLGVRSLETGWYIYSTDLKSGQAHVSVHRIFEGRPLMDPLKHTERL